MVPPLWQAVQSTTALVVTGGTNSGVMRLAGRALADYNATFQCLGIATWGVINGRNHLADSHEVNNIVTLERNMGNSPMGVNLEPNHSHFLLVDNQKVRTTRPHTLTSRAATLSRTPRHLTSAPR